MGMCEAGRAVRGRRVIWQLWESACGEERSSLLARPHWTDHNDAATS